MIFLKKMIGKLAKDGFGATAKSIATLPARRHARQLPRSVLEKILAHAIIKNEFAEIAHIPSFTRREDLWADTFSRLSSTQVTVLEFGVFEGYSIKRFAELNIDQSSRFTGFDSFIGLPENWTPGFKKGAFGVDGTMPQIDDPRVRFVKGWFQNTLPGFLQDFNPLGSLLVHYDADIYSATLYVMSELDRLKLPYFAIFDEFPGDEARALLEYMKMSGSRVEFIAKAANPEGYPLQISCRITPATIYEV